MVRLTSETGHYFFGLNDLGDSRDAIDWAQRVEERVIYDVHVVYCWFVGVCRGLQYLGP